MSKDSTIGIDIGGTKTLCLLLDEKFKVLEEIKFKTEPNEGRERFSSELVDALKSLRKSAKDRDLNVAGVGVGCAGQVDKAKCVIKVSPNLLSLEDYRIGHVIRKATGLATVLGNDVQLGLWGEHQMGAAAGFRHVVGVFFGTGVGGAAILNGRLYEGASGLGGQVGAILAQPVGGPEAAQSHGILDRIASKAAIASEAAQMSAKQWAPYLHKNVGSDISQIGWGVLAKAIEEGDDRVEEMMRARMQVVGIALSSVINFLNPELLVLGGGLVDEMPKLVVSEVKEGIRKYLVPEVAEALDIKPAGLKSRAVAMGAARFAFQELA
jgi:glucokinase